MREGWKRVKLGEVTKVRGGKRLPKNHELVSISTDHKYIRARDIKGGKINFDNPTYLTNETFSCISRYIVSKDDLILTIVGANIGDVGMVTKEFDKSNLTENAVKITCNENEIISKFLLYSLLPQYSKDYLQVLASGAAQDKLGLYKINIFEINLPPLETQRKIASILSGYDDFIENNLKRIKILEEMAQQTYEEWFVRMRFPGYETAVMNEENGLPIGWSEIDLNENIKVKHGYAFKGEYFKLNETDRVLLTPGNFRIGGGIKLDKIKYYDGEISLPKEYILEKHDLLLTMTDLSKDGDTLGYPLLVPSSFDKTYLHNQRLGKIIPKNEKCFPKYFLRMYFQDYRYRSFVVGSANGATVKHTSPTKILFFKPQLPSFDSNIISQFDSFAKPVFELIDKLLLEQSLLKESRDILLPRLMMGMIKV